VKRWLVASAVVAASLAGAYVLHAPGKQEGRAIAAANAPGPGKAAPPPLPPDARVRETLHYRIHSTATIAQTEQVARAVESLHERYAAMFPPGKAGQGRLVLVLYRDRAEFKRNNRSRPWAEAYYLAPRSHAYFDATARNPYHWMLHEATHQLMREVSAFPRRKWIDEGVASYFGAGTLGDGALRTELPDPDAYPIWWLPQQALSGNLQQDIASGRIIPLARLIDGRGGPDENRYFNLYYIHYWSLAHFLFHYRDGRYAQGFRQLIGEGGTLEDFERRIGPVDQVQREWYGYLLEHVRGAQ